MTYVATQLETKKIELLKKFTRLRNEIQQLKLQLSDFSGKVIQLSRQQISDKILKQLLFDFPNVEESPFVLFSKGILVNPIVLHGTYYSDLHNSQISWSDIDTIAINSAVLARLNILQDIPEVRDSMEFNQKINEKIQCIRKKIKETENAIALLN